MSARLKRNFNLLQVLQKAPPKQRKAILSTATRDLVLCISEIVDNILKGNLKLTKKQVARLKRYKNVLRNMANKKVSTKTKQKLLSQKGGFLSALLGPAIGIIGSLLGNVFQR